MYLISISAKTSSVKMFLLQYLCRKKTVDWPCVSTSWKSCFNAALPGITWIKRKGLSKHVYYLRHQKVIIWVQILLLIIFNNFILNFAQFSKWRPGNFKVLHKLMIGKLLDQYIICLSETYSSSRLWGTQDWLKLR